MSKLYKLPPKKTIGVITNDGIIDICSKFLLTTPINYKTKIFEDQREVDKVLSSIGSVYKQIKKSEQSPPTDYLMHGINSGSSVDKTAKKLEAMNSLGLIGIRK